MKYISNILQKWNIQIFIIFVSIDFILDYLYEVTRENPIKLSLIEILMLISSILVLIISAVLYMLYLKNTTKIKKLLQNKEENTEKTIDRIGKELNYILVNLIIFLIYSFIYSFFMLGVAMSQ